MPTMPAVMAATRLPAHGSTMATTRSRTSSSCSDLAASPIGRPQSGIGSARRTSTVAVQLPTGAGGGAADDADPTVGEHHGRAIPVEPRPAHVGEGFALDGLHRRRRPWPSCPGSDRARCSAARRGRRPGRGRARRGRPTTWRRAGRWRWGRTGGRRCGWCATAAPGRRPHPGEVGGVEGQGGAERAAAHVAPAVGADQDVGDRFRDDRAGVAVGAGGELERGGHDVGRPGPTPRPAGGDRRRRPSSAATRSGSPGRRLAVAVAARHERLEPQAGGLRRRAHRREVRDLRDVPRPRQRPLDEEVAVGGGRGADRVDGLVASPLGTSRGRGPGGTVGSATGRSASEGRRVGHVQHASRSSASTKPASIGGVGGGLELLEVGVERVVALGEARRVDGRGGPEQQADDGPAGGRLAASGPMSARRRAACGRRRPRCRGRRARSGHRRRRRPRAARPSGGAVAARGPVARARSAALTTTCWGPSLIGAAQPSDVGARAEHVGVGVGGAGDLPEPDASVSGWRASTSSRKPSDVGLGLDDEHRHVEVGRGWSWARRPGSRRGRCSRRRPSGAGAAAPAVHQEPVERLGERLHAVDVGGQRERRLRLAHGEDLLGLEVAERPRRRWTRSRRPGCTCRRRTASPGWDRSP